MNINFQHLTVLSFFLIRTQHSVAIPSAGELVEIKWYQKLLPNNFEFLIPLHNVPYVYIYTHDLAEYVSTLWYRPTDRLNVPYARNQSQNGNIFYTPYELNISNFLWLFWHIYGNRSMNENSRLGEIVEAVKQLEQAFIKDTGIPSKK